MQASRIFRGAYAAVLESEDSAVSNTAVRKDVWVRVPPAAPFDSIPWPKCRATPPDPTACVDERGLGPLYVYLLGVYLGDGMLSRQANGVWRLRVFQDARYADIIKACAGAMIEIAGNRVNSVRRQGCLELVSTWKHWLCVFPQHGSGPKHLRKISLEAWQLQLVERHPKELIKGLIHSDGCRVINRVRNRLGVRYQYPRYFFTNHSDDIRATFVHACELIGVEYRPNNRWNISVAKRGSVAILDEFIGLKS